MRFTLNIDDCNDTPAGAREVAACLRKIAHDLDFLGKSQKPSDFGDNTIYPPRRRDGPIGACRFE